MARDVARRTCGAGFLLFLGAFVLGSAPPAVGAEIVYVTDTLRVGLRTEPDGRVPPIGVVVTGAKLEVLARSRGFVKVRTEQGLEGWLKEIYVASQPSALERLEALEREHAALTQQLAQAQRAVAQANAAQQGLTEEADKLRREAVQMHAERAQPQVQRRDIRSAQRSGWLAVGWALTVIAAFAAGVVWHRYRLSKRLRGLRV
jgi:SH3 domain protein